MAATWLIEQLTESPTGAGFWLILSCILAVIATVVTRLVSPELGRPVRVARLVLVPYFGLILGGLSPRLMGLTDVGWDSRFIVGVVVLAGLLVLLVLIRIWIHTETGPFGGFGLTGRSWSPTPIECLAQEFHWCFLRGATWELLPFFATASLSPEYWAVWIGAALALPGIYLHRIPLSDRLLTTLVLVTTSSLFLITQSFWLCCLLHLGIRGILLWNQPSQQRAL